VAEKNPWRGKFHGKKESWESKTSWQKNKSWEMKFSCQRKNFGRGIFHGRTKNPGKGKLHCRKFWERKTRWHK
jgi:hypothetical protein